MATSTRLILECLNGNGVKRTMSWSNINPASQASFVRAFIAALISTAPNLMRDPITSVTSAILRTTTDTGVDISE